MELIATEIEDTVPTEFIHYSEVEDTNGIGTLSCALNREGATFSSARADSFTPVGGNKIIKNILSGSDWVDPNTFKVQLDLVNNGGAGEILRPLNTPHAFCKSMRMIVGGA